MWSKKGYPSSYGYKRGTPILLAVCNLTIQYAADVSQEAGGATVYFTQGHFNLHRGSDGKVSSSITGTGGKPSALESISRVGTQFVYTDANGTSANYNPKTGMATQDVPGSRIPTATCVDPKLCGGK
jgi:hypothetical protein